MTSKGLSREDAVLQVKKLNRRAADDAGRALISLNDAPESRKKQVIREQLATKKFGNFLSYSEESKAGWPVGKTKPGMLKDMKYDSIDGSKTVVLSGDSVMGHPRYANPNIIKPEDFKKVQDILDKGRWAFSTDPNKKSSRSMWIQDKDGTGWVAVIKKTDRGEMYLTSFSRVHERRIRYWERIRKRQTRKR